MQVEDKVWIATVLDCEGSICLGKNARKIPHADGTFVINVSYAPNITIVNTNLELLEKCRRLLGTKELVKNHSSRMGCKPVYHIFLRNRQQILILLREILPYLICKREIATRMIAWLEWFDSKRMPGGKRQHKVLMPDSDRIAMRSEYDRMAEYTREAHSWAGKATPN